MSAYKNQALINLLKVYLDFYCNYYGKTASISASFLECP